MSAIVQIAKSRALTFVSALLFDSYADSYNDVYLVRVYSRYVSINRTLCRLKSTAHQEPVMMLSSEYLALSHRSIYQLLGYPSCYSRDELINIHPRRRLPY